MKEVLIATTNSGKAKIYEEAFKSLNIKILTLRDFDIKQTPEENGKSVVENAVIKAKFYHEITKLPVLANDSGLIIHKFSKEDQPGLFVRRFKSQDLSDEQMLEKYIGMLNKVGGSSSAHYNVGLAIIDENKKLHTKLFKPKRFFINKASSTIIKGIPLSSLAYDKKTKKYMSEMNFEERNKFEGKAFKKQEKFIKKYFN